MWSTVYQNDLFIQEFYWCLKLSKCQHLALKLSGERPVGYACVCGLCLGEWCNSCLWDSRTTGAIWWILCCLALAASGCYSSSSSSIIFLLPPKKIFSSLLLLIIPYLSISFFLHFISFSSLIPPFGTSSLSATSSPSDLRHFFSPWRTIPIRARTSPRADSKGKNLRWG